MGSEIYAAAESRLAKSKYHNSMHFLGHGMGGQSRGAAAHRDWYGTL
jgi:hypothetical protein